MSSPEHADARDAGNTVTLDILRRAQAGERAAFDELFLSVEPKLQLYIRMRYTTPGQVGAREGVEDILQRTYMEALRVFDTFEYRGAGSFYRWMREIARLCIARTFDVHRKARCRDAALEVPLDAMPAGQAGEVAAGARNLEPPSSPSRRVRRDEKLAALGRALEEIPDHYREVVVLHKIEERSFAETASILGRTEAACKMIYFRAMRALRKQLGKDRGMADATELS